MAVFNYGYPMGYQPLQVQPSPQPQQGINWVQGIAGAKAFMVAPGQTAFLMDSEGQTFYMKSADQSGMPTLRVFDFQERTQQPPAASQNAGVYEDLVKRVAALEDIANMVKTVKNLEIIKGMAEEKQGGGSWRSYGSYEDGVSMRGGSYHDGGGQEMRQAVEEFKRKLDQMI